MFAYCATRIELVHFGRQARLQAHIVQPAVGEVVRIEEAFARPEAKLAKPDLMRIVCEDNFPWGGEAEIFAVDAEAVEMPISPAQGDLKDAVQVSEGGVG